MSELHLRNLPVPFLSQRKNGYEWKTYYTDNEAKGLGKPELMGKVKEKYSMASRSCNITSLAMVLHYFGLTKDSPDSIMISYYNETHKDKIESEKKKSVLFKGMSYYGKNGVDALEQWGNLYGLVKAVYTQDCEYYENYPIKEIKASIAAGYPVIANNGVLARTDEKGNNVTIQEYIDKSLQNEKHSVVTLAKEHTKLLINAGVFSTDEEKKVFKFLKDEVLLADELKEFYAKTDRCQNLATYHISEWAQGIQWKSDKSLGISGGRALNSENTEDYIKNYYNRFVWMNKNIFEKDENITDNKAWFYHPIRFLELIAAKG